MVIERLEFLAPIGCRNEVFTTARLGHEWRTKVQAGTREVLMVDAEGTSIGKAEIADIWVGPMSHVPAIFLDHYHDPICRTWAGLQAVLQGTYDTPVEYSTEVTLLRLRYTGGAVQIATAADMPPASFGKHD